VPGGGGGLPTWVSKHAAEKWAVLDNSPATVGAANVTCVRQRFDGGIDMWDLGGGLSGARDPMAMRVIVCGLTSGPRPDNKKWSLNFKLY
jgi:hypothetical protein